MASAWASLKTGVEIMSKNHHKHIVEYLGSQDCDMSDAPPKIFMSLRDGDLSSLIKNMDKNEAQSIYVNVRHHILQALDFLSTKRIVHQDVKPSNILYKTRPDHPDGYKYSFELTDFGLSSFQSMATNHKLGTRLFKAPEIVEVNNTACDDKVDVWSLFVTLICTLDFCGYLRSKYYGLYTDDQAIQATLEIARHASVYDIKEMAVFNPLERASAAQMLVKLYKSNGLTTKSNLIPPLLDA